MRLIKTDATDKFSMTRSHLSLIPCTCSTAVTACGPVYNKKIAGLCPSENVWHDSEPSFSGFPCVPLPSPNQKRFFSVFKVSLNMTCWSDLDSADVEKPNPIRAVLLFGAPRWTPTKDCCMVCLTSVNSWFIIPHSDFVV